MKHRAIIRRHPDSSFLISTSSLSRLPVLILLVGLLCTGLSAQQPDHAIVPAFEKFADVEEISDVERGLLLLNELNCTSCHESTSAIWATAPKQAPILSELGTRVRPEYLPAYLIDPHSVKPGTSMPSMLDAYPVAERTKIAEALTHFLASTGETSDTPPLPGPIAAGEKLFHSIGCVACHNPQNSDPTYPTSVPLGDLSTKYTIPGLTSFLSNPLAVRPSGRMPHLSLSDGEAQQIATYLLRDIKLKSNVNVAYYEGSWDNLPDFDSLMPASRGSVPFISPKVGARNDNFGAVFTGYWKITQAGKYKFRIGSDDGSRLLIDGKRILNNDGIHGMEFVERTVDLQPGTKAVRVEFFEKAGGEELVVEVSGPGLAKQPLSSLLRAEKEPPMEDKGFVLDKTKAELGAAYFRSVGCANCHEMKQGDQLLESSYVTAKPVTELTGAGGCLEARGNSPRFALTEKQKESIAAALKHLQGSPQTASQETRIHQALSSLNCYSCHERNFVGGVVDRRGESLEVYGREKWFTSDQPEMGDEGRLPPLLTGVGGKLNAAWLAEAIENGHKIRPYMMTRMPRFGSDNTRKLVKDLVEVDKLSDPIVVEFELAPRKVKAIGKAFVGTSEKENGLSCVKCHTFGKYEATGIQALSLTSMTKRLNKDWFLKYMRKPSRFRPGTRMPESWPGGKTFFPDVLDGDSNKQIAAIWEYLTDGEKAAKPKGLVQAKMQLVATDVPRIYRNFIEGAGPRAIGIGYPSEVNLAFDANQSRLAMIWQGAFIDASRHWAGRGQGYQPPLGDNVLKFPEGVPFMTPDRAADAWPTGSGKELGVRFDGYRFNEDRQPTFLYHLDDVQIEDQPLPKVDDGYANFVRQFQVTASKTDTVWFRAAAAKKITQQDDGTFNVNGDYRLKFTDTVQPKIRTVNGQQELLVPVDLKKGSAKFSVEYIW